MRRFPTFISIVFLCATVHAQNNPVENSLIDAISLFNEQCIDAARDSLTSVVARDSTLDAAWYYLAMIDYSRGDKEACIADFEKAVALDSANCWYQEGLASVLSSDGQRGRATEIYLKLLELYPKKYRSSYTLSLLADQMLASGEDSLAFENYSQALEYDSRYVPALVGIAEIYQHQGRFVEFFDQLATVFVLPEVTEEIKSQYLVSIIRGSSSAFHRQWEKQIRGLADTIAGTHGNSVSALELVIQLDLFYEDTPAAIADCFRLADAAGDDMDRKVVALAEAGDLYHQTGNEAKAFEMYEQVLSIRPDYAPVLNNYAYFLFLKGRKLRKALKMSAVTIEQEPDNPTYLDTYGCLLFVLGKPEQAKPYFKHALIYGGKDNPELLRHYSEVLDALGEKDLADYYRMQIKDK